MRLSIFLSNHVSIQKPNIGLYKKKVLKIKIPTHLIIHYFMVKIFISIK